MIEPRQLTATENAILDTLLSLEFPGRSELVAQRQTAKVTVLDGEGSLRFHVEQPVLAGVMTRVPVEAQADDTDDVPVHFLLHVLNGCLHELEIFREDSKGLRGEINPSTLRAIAYYQS